MQSTHNLLVFNVPGSMYVYCCMPFKHHFQQLYVKKGYYHNWVYQSYRNMDKILLAFMMIVHYSCANKIFAL